MDIDKNYNTHKEHFQKIDGYRESLYKGKPILVKIWLSLKNTFIRCIN